MRYRDGCQAECSCSDARGGEWTAMLGDAVNGEQQFVHARDQGDLGQLAARTQSLIVVAQPGIEAHRGQRRHPQRGTEAGVAEGSQGGGLGSDAVDSGEQAADFMATEFIFDVVVELAQSLAQRIEVLAGVADLDAIGGAVMLADGAAGGVDEGARRSRPT